MTTPAPHTPDEREYDAERDAFESWHLAICELRKAYLREMERKATDTKAPGDG